MLCYSAALHPPTTPNLTSYGTILPFSKTKVTIVNAVDLSLYWVVDPDQCGGARATVNLLHKLLPHGISVVQLRAPTWKKRELLALAQEMRTLTREANIPFIINDHLDIALGCEADGLHVGQHDLPLAVARRWMGEKAILGLSANQPAHFQADDVLLADYLGVGPVFATSTKSDAAPPLGVEGLKQCLGLTRRPVVAIGGITVENAEQLRDSGVAGLAVVSALCRAADPVHACHQLNRAFFPEIRLF